MALQACEALLEKFDPNFDPNVDIAAPTYKLLQKLNGDAFMNAEADMREKHQLFLNIERVRVSEAIFRPELAGIDQAGLEEILDMLLQRINANESVPTPHVLLFY